MKVTLQPSGHSFEVAEGQNIVQAGLDAGFSMPYSCRTGVCKHLPRHHQRGQGRLRLRAPELPARQRQGEGLRAALPGEAALRLRDRGARAGGPGRHQAAHVALPRDEDRRSPAPDVAVLGLRLPSNENMLFLAGQYIDFLLKDGKRRSYSIATQAGAGGRHRARAARPPHARRRVHRPRVRRHEGEGDPALRGAARHLLPARGLRQADRDGGERHRLRADQGDVRGHAGEGHEAPGDALLGLPREARPVHARRAVVLERPELQVRPGAVRPDARVRSGPAAPASCTAR